MHTCIYCCLQTILIGFYYTSYSMSPLHVKFRSQKKWAELKYKITKPMFPFPREIELTNGVQIRISLANMLFHIRNWVNNGVWLRIILASMPLKPVSFFNPTQPNWGIHVDFHTWILCIVHPIRIYAHEQVWSGNETVFANNRHNDTSPTPGLFTHSLATVAATQVLPGRAVWSYRYPLTCRTANKTSTSTPIVSFRVC